MTKSVFDFKAYKSYLLYETERKPAQRGLKSLLAKALGCQSAYLSQVLKGSAELSPEQGLRACEFFRLGQDEQDYLMLLLQKDRAGTQDLKTYFQKQINDLLKKRMNLVKRLGKESHLSETDKNTYYSSWIYSAIHLAVTIKKLQSKEALQRHFQLPAKQITTVLDFLIRTGLVHQQGSTLSAGVNIIRLGNDSHLIYKHHTNWRLQAVDSLEKESLTDLHYSAVLTLSSADIQKIKDLLLEQLKANLEIVKTSHEEEICVLNIDFFNLKKGIEE